MIELAKKSKNIVALKPKDDQLVPANLEYAIEKTLKGENQQPSLIKIRLPQWVQFDWTGDWSKSSTKWSSEQKTELNVDSDEHFIWMSWDEILEKFSKLIICQIKEITEEPED